MAPRSPTTRLAADAVDGATPVGCTPAQGAAFPLGTTIVECSASDAAGNVAAGSFPVHVRDTTAPALDLPAALTREATGPDGAVVNYGASATDLVDGPVAVRGTPESGRVLPLGRITVDCSARDRAGNGAEGSFDIEVADRTPPSITTPGDLTVAATSDSGADLTFDASASDAVDGTVAVACTPASGTTLPVGATTVSCRATDARGNEGSADFTATVTPFEPLPAVSLLDGRSLEGSDGGTTALEIHLRLSAPADPAGVTVRLATADGTAVVGDDYVATEAEVHIPGGADSATVAVPVVADRDAEPDETFAVAITGAEGARVERAEAVATILDDDRPPPTVSVDDAAVLEGDAGDHRAGVPGAAVGHVAAGRGGRLEHAPGHGDLRQRERPAPRRRHGDDPGGADERGDRRPDRGRGVPELDETLSVDLAEPSGASIGQGTATGTIVNDDAGAACVDAEGDGGDHPYALVAGGARWVRLTGHTLCAAGDRDFLRPEDLATPPAGAAHMWVEVTIRGRRGARGRAWRCPAPPRSSAATAPSTSRHGRRTRRSWSSSRAPAAPTTSRPACCSPDQRRSSTSRRAQVARAPCASRAAGRC